MSPIFLQKQEAISIADTANEQLAELTRQSPRLVVSRTGTMWRDADGPNEGFWAFVTFCNDPVGSTPTVVARNVRAEISMEIDGKSLFDEPLCGGWTERTDEANPQPPAIN